MKNKLKEFAALISWFLLTMFTLITCMTTNIILVEKHYFNFAFVLLSIVAFAGGKAIGHLVTLLMLIMGLMAQAAFMPGVYWFAIGSFKIAWPFLPLIVLFVALNYLSIPAWFNAALGYQRKS